MPSHCAHHPPHPEGGGEANTDHSTTTGMAERDSDNCSDGAVKSDNAASPHEKHPPSHDPEAADGHGGGHDHHHHDHGGKERPMFATVTVAVCHCGAGCVLGDIIGEWIVYGTNATINGRTLWPAYLIGTSLFG